MIEWNQVKYIDCMDVEEGLPSLPDKSIDLVFTDFPFNVKFKGTAQDREKIVLYKDNNGSYSEFCNDVFLQLKRISNGQIIFCGNTNLPIWYNIETPRDLVIHYKPNCQGSSSVSYLSKFDSLLFYGKFKGRIPTNVIKYNVKIGRNRETDGIHPCPGVFNLYKHIIKWIKPTSVIDPFMGSGTTAEVCTKLGIPWLGYELNEVYSQDINKRLKNCKREPKQITLEGIQWA